MTHYPDTQGKNLIELAYTAGEQLGLDVWCEDEAGPFQTAPVPGASWQAEGEPAEYPGVVRVKGVKSCTNEVLHPWLKQELAAIVAGLPTTPTDTDMSRAQQQQLWERWQEGLSIRITLPAEPPLRMLLVLDNLAGHKMPSFLCWCFEPQIMPLYTPLGGSYVQRRLQYIPHDD